MAVKRIPDGHNTVSPYVNIDGAQRAFPDFDAHTPGKVGGSLG